MQLTRYERTGVNSAAAMRERMRRTGLNAAGQLLWSEDEVATLQRLYPDYTALVQTLPRRTRTAIKSKATKLGIARDRRIWLPGEFSIKAKPPYVAGTVVRDIAAQLHQKTAPQIYAKASRRKVRRPRRAPKLFGDPILDSIRQRAFELNMTLAGLCQETCSGTYFYRRGPTNWVFVARALKVLAGQAIAVWH